MFRCHAGLLQYEKEWNGTLPEGIHSPPQVAAALVAHITTQSPNGGPLVTELSVQGPGFILCRVASTYLQRHVQKLLMTQQLPKPQNLKQQQCVVDFSSPNIAKEMHVGHLRSTIIGESVCRILEFVGHKVERINHVGDWGTQFGMLIEYLKVEFPNFSSDQPNITDLTSFYKSAKERFDADADFKKISQLNVVKLQSGDAECLKVWTILCDISRREFQKVYSRLDVTVHECGESFYNDKIPPVI
jgi:arginyl-tRNA synthetase